ncbi:mechanosensitive ion channel domain-containing protein [Isoalcanivorax indicus]|uniref:mechanosensitive ion channel domain-containing protein n=1 Tax=Isoalcanivorax indicus TaxID=2202653 RepID=UPI000DBA876E|nr:mechanosensitive ion channel domain-containing protein [Isoalcanivorax indicus]
MAELDQTLLRLLISTSVVVAALVLSSLLRRLVQRLGEGHGYAASRMFQVKVLINLTTLMVLLFALGATWGFSGQGFVVFASSVFALVGVALFAAWSLLSNTTAALILFFSAPFRVGDRIRMLDGDNTVTGEVVDMGLVTITLRDTDGHHYNIPNNMVFQRTVIRLSANKDIPCDKKHVR